MSNHTTASSPLSIELRHLRYFLAVYDELHFGRAAERLHMAQPPLSRAIRQLERELGLELFERTSRGVMPTAAGRVFAEESRKVLTGFDFTVAEARRVGLPGVSLQVGCVPYVPTRRLQRFLSGLRERESSVPVEVTHLLGLDQVDRLRTGGLDLGVLSHAEDYDGLEWEPLFPAEPIYAFIPREHRLAEKDVLTPEDLAPETLLTYPRATNPPFYDRFMALFREAGYRFTRLHEMNADPRDVLLGIAGGLGIALAPLSISEINDVGDDVVWRAIDPEVSFPDTIVAWRARPPRHLQPRLAAVRDIARELHEAT